MICSFRVGSRTISVLMTHHRSIGHLIKAIALPQEWTSRLRYTALFVTARNNYGQCKKMALMPSRESYNFDHTSYLQAGSLKNSAMFIAHLTLVFHIDIIVYCIEDIDQMNLRDSFI